MLKCSSNLMIGSGSEDLTLDDVQDTGARMVYDLSGKDHRILEAGCRTVGISFFSTPICKIGIEAAVKESLSYPVLVIL